MCPSIVRMCAEAVDGDNTIHRKSESSSAHLRVHSILKLSVSFVLNHLKPIRPTFSPPTGNLGDDRVQER